MTQADTNGHEALVDLRGAPETPPGSKFFHFHAVFGKKNLKNNSTLGVGAPPRENPGSATVKDQGCYPLF